MAGVRLSGYDRKIARIAKRLRNYPVGRSSHEVTWDLIKDLDSSRGSQLFLGVFGDLALQDLLEKFGFIPALAERGITNPKIVLGLDDPFRYIFRLFEQKAEPGSLIIELVVRRVTRYRLLPTGPEEKYRCLCLDWLLMQNPFGQYSRQKPLLPGQENPGLGLGSMVLSLFTQLARNLRLDAILTTPTNCFSALYFFERFFSLVPSVQAELSGLRRCAHRNGLAHCAWAETYGDILDGETGEPYHWSPTELVQLVRPDLIRLLAEDSSYFQQAEDRHRRFSLRKGIRYDFTAEGKLVRTVQDS
ncbi:hypothetical protein ACFLZR_01395 [Candidatus Neomarinimicrobiota bacterium]